MFLTHALRAERFCIMNANNKAQAQTDWKAVGKGALSGVVQGLTLVAAATAGSLIAAAILAKTAKKD